MVVELGVVNADVDGANQKSIGPFSFAVTSCSGPSNVTGFVNNGTSLDVRTGDTAGSFTPKVRFTFPAADRFHVQIAGAKRTTAISQQQTGSTASVTIAASSGTYTGAPCNRANVVELVSDTQASAVTLNGSALTQYPAKAAFDAASGGWYNAGGNLVVAKSGSLSTATAKTFSFTTGQSPVSATFTCANGTNVSGQSVYAVGGVPQLGEWSVASAVKLEPTSYSTWTGTVSGLPPNTTVEWKCVKRQEAGYPDTADAWQPGVNTTFSTPSTGSAGATSGTF
jgi:alpha-glucosidase